MLIYYFLLVFGLYGISSRVHLGASHARLVARDTVNPVPIHDDAKFTPLIKDKETFKVELKKHICRDIEEFLDYLIHKEFKENSETLLGYLKDWFQGEFIGNWGDV